MKPLLLIKTGLYSLVVPGTVLFYVPWRILTRHGEALRLPSWHAGSLPAVLMILAGVAMYLRCAGDFVVRGRGTPAHLDPPAQFVRSGLYRWMRNPMYQGVLMTILGIAWAYLNVSVLRYALGTAVSVHLIVMLAEEPVLRRKFGASYAAYCRSVPRWGLALRKLLAHRTLS